MHKLTSLPVTPQTTLEKAREIAIKTGLKYVYIGNIPGHHAESTSCPSCHHVVLERRGFSIMKNSLKNGKCAACGTPIAGTWI
jgi:pyruvate formate lyase activating enzyme